MAPGAKATVPTRSSSGAHDSASSLVEMAACPPCEPPIASHRLPAPVSLMLRAARTASITLWASLMRER